MAFDGFEELASSPVLDISPDFQGAVREAKVAWSRIDELSEFLFPVGDLTAPFPGKTWLRARSLHVEPFVGPKSKITEPTNTADHDHDTLNEYGTAKVRVTYETMPSEQGQGDDPTLVLSHRWAIGGEFVTIDVKALRWCDSTFVQEDVATPGKFIPTIEHQITWPRVPSPPFSVIRSRVGKVNEETLNFKTGVIAPETLLFLGAELNRDILTTGALAWEVVYRFSEKRVTANDDGCNPAATVGGWNHFLRSERADEEITDPKSGFFRLYLQPNLLDDPTDIYELATFVPLFVQGT